MLDAKQLNEFRTLFDYARVVLEHFRNKPSGPRNPEKRLSIFGAARMALDELELRYVCDQIMKRDGEDHFADLPLHILALRDLVCYVKYDIDRRLFVRLYGPQAENFLPTLLMILESYLRDMNVSTDERQPYWRDEACKLYIALPRNDEGETLQGPKDLNPAAERFLLQRFKDHEEGGPFGQV